MEVSRVDQKMERILNANFADENKEKDLPHKILSLIFDNKPEGISVGEIKSILNEAQEIAESIQMVPLDS